MAGQGMAFRMTFKSIAAQADFTALKPKNMPKNALNTPSMACGGRLGLVQWATGKCPLGARAEGLGMGTALAP